MWSYQTLFAQMGVLPVSLGKTRRFSRLPRSVEDFDTSTGCGLSPLKLLDMWNISSHTRVITRQRFMGKSRGQTSAVARRMVLPCTFAASVEDRSAGRSARARSLIAERNRKNAVTARETAIGIDDTRLEVVVTAGSRFPRSISVGTKVHGSALIRVEGALLHRQRMVSAPGGCEREYGLQPWASFVFVLGVEEAAAIIPGLCCEMVDTFYVS